jgi:DNA-binding response OmpR family regulator
MYDAALGQERHDLLTREGFHVLTVNNNFNAQKECERHRFAAIVVGFASPLPNRRSIARWLREHCPGVPIVGLFSEKFLPLRGADHSIDGTDWRTLVHTLRRIISN